MDSSCSRPNQKRKIVQSQGSKRRKPEQVEQLSGTELTILG